MTDVKPLQISVHFPSGLIAAVSILFQAAPDDALDTGRNGGVELTHRRRWVMQNGVMNGSTCTAFESAPACDHLKQHKAEREEIAPRVQFFATYLLG